MEGVMDETLARILAYQSNIERYSRLLETKLTDIEREYIQSRLSEERSALEGLASPTSAAHLRPRLDRGTRTVA